MTRRLTLWTRLRRLLEYRLSVRWYRPRPRTRKGITWVDADYDERLGEIIEVKERAPLTIEEAQLQDQKPDGKGPLIFTKEPRLTVKDEE